MKTTKKIIKNRSDFSNRQEHKYNIYAGSTPIRYDKSNTEKTIKHFNNNLNLMKVVNLKQVLKSQELGIKFFTEHFINIGTPNVADIKFDQYNARADFVFQDFDQGDLPFETAHEILLASEYNFILSTSISHSDEIPKLHVLIPTLKPITDKGVYLYYWENIQKTLFNGYQADTKAQNITRWKASNHPNTTRLEYRFDGHDYELEIPTVAVNAMKRITQVESSSYIPTYTDDKQDFAKEQVTAQASSMYQLIPDKSNTNPNIRTFHRDINDKHPMLHYSPYNTKYANNVIWDKKKGYHLMFSEQNYAESEYECDLETVRSDVLNAIEEELQDFFYNPKEGNKKYLVTNEGVGKSTTILNLALNNSFIYVAHTLEKLDELAEDLKKRNVKVIKLLGTNKIIDMVLCDHKYRVLCSKLKAEYKDYITNKESVNAFDKISFREFLVNCSVNGLTEAMKTELLETYHEEATKLTMSYGGNYVILMTMRKLQTLLVSNNEYINKNNLPIVFDEFIYADWLPYTLKKQSQYQKVGKVVKSMWNDGTAEINLYENKNSFLELIKDRSVLILTTEMSLADIVFYGTEYTKMRHTTEGLKALCKVDMKTFDMVWDKKSILHHRVYSPNIIYMLNPSTNKSGREELIVDVIERFKNYLHDPVVISDGVTNSDHSHLAVKGKNDLSTKDTIIIGSLCNEQEQVLLRESCSNYFKKFEKIQFEKLVQEKSNSTNNKQQIDIISECRIGFDEHYTKVQNSMITDILMESSINQSIGRNQGFRAQGSKTVVVLPLQHSKHHHVISRNLNLSYTSPNVLVS